eukprot:s37_g8.t1
MFAAPKRCVAVCNPSCCANCINPQTGRDDGDATAVSAEGRNGNIFANASAVLSEDDRQDPTADFDLEKELANEVLVFALRSRPQPRVEGPSEAWKAWAAGACALLDEHFWQRPIQEDP